MTTFIRINCLLFSFFLLSQKAFSQYCIPTSGGGFCITNVSLATLNSPTNSCSPNNYFLFPDTTAINQGQAYTLTVATNSAAMILLWIDWNQNFTFENSEFNMIGQTTTMATFTVNVPLTSLTGITRMRIRSMTGMGSTINISPCAASTTGEAEDYVLSVLPSVGPTSVQTMSEIESMSVSPNPVSDMLSIHVPESMKNEEKQLFNLYGQQVISTRDNLINLTQLPKGLYILKCGELTQKVSIQ